MSEEARTAETIESVKGPMTKVPLVKYVQCVFEGTNPTQYTFRTRIQDLKVNDLVVAETSNGVKLVEVVSLEVPTRQRCMATRWIFQKVDFGELEKLRG